MLLNRVNHIHGDTMSVDYIEQGKGQTVILLHSTAAGNRQWKKLIELLSDDYRVIAPNLFGYGATDKWSDKRSQTLKDQAEIIRQFVPSDGSKFSLVGHSFGGSIAMMGAKIFQHHLDKLILIEPNPNYLLRDMGRSAEFNEILELRNCIKINGANKSWEVAAEVFANYFNGSGAWNAMNIYRREKFMNALKPNFHEWDAVINEQTSIKEWKSCLPKNTTVLSCVKTISSISGIIKILRANMKSWDFIEYSEGGHMAPLTNPDIINPIIIKALRG